MQLALAASIDTSMEKCYRNEIIIIVIVIIIIITTIKTVITV